MGQKFVIYIIALSTLVFNAHLYSVYFSSKENLSIVGSAYDTIYVVSIVFLLIIFLSFLIFFQRIPSLELLSFFTSFSFIPLFIISFALLYREVGLKNVTENIDYLYFSIVTFTTLGYGDIQPSSDAKIFAAIEAVIGFLFVPILVSQVLSVIRDLR